MRRPIEVALSAVWGFVAAAAALVLAIAGALVLSQGGEPAAAFEAAWRWEPLFHVIRAGLSAVMFAISSAYLLGGRRWARDLFVGWSWLQLILNFALGPHFLGGWGLVSFLQLVPVLVSSYLLLTGSTAQYFEVEPAS